MTSDIDFGFHDGDAIVVTGAASGIGKAIAIRAAQLGLAVSAWDLNGEGVRATAEEIREAGGNAEPSEVDVTVGEQIEAGFVTARSLGTVRHLANVAGPHSGPREFEFSPSLTDAIGSMQNVVNSWLRPGAPAGASLVNIASVAGNVIGTGSAWYSAAKAGIVGWTKHLAAYRSDEVRSNAVGPGTILTTRSQAFAKTDLGAHILNRVPSHRQGTPDEVAWAVLFLLSPLASYINGAFLVVDGGWTVTQ